MGKNIPKERKEGMYKVYTEIMSETNASSATISRVNRMLNYGTGCLGEVIDRLDKKEDKEGTEES